MEGARDSFDGAVLRAADASTAERDQIIAAATNAFGNAYSSIMFTATIVLVVAAFAIWVGSKAWP